MPQLPLESHVLLLKALANESRLKIIALVTHQEQSVSSLANSLQLTEPTISHHLAKLSQAGLVHMRAIGTTHCYRLNNLALHALSKSLFSQTETSQDELSDNGDESEARVLKSFIVAGRLSKIPEGLRKRMIILRWLLTKFEDDRKYSEREVNEIIKGCHPDFATIRREFIGHQLMERENGSYTKIKEAQL